MHCSATSASSLLANRSCFCQTLLPVAEIACVRTFHLSLQGAQVGLVDPDESLFPVPCPLDHLADFLRLLFVGQGSDPIAGYDVLEHRKLGQKRKFTDDGVVVDRLRMRRRRYFRK